MMKKILLALALGLVYTTVSAQELSKEELKALKKEIKALTPQDYVQLKGDLESLKVESENLQTKVTELESGHLSLENKNAELQDEVAQLKGKLVQAAAEKKVDEYTTYDGAHSKGVVYKVQVGAFKGLDMRKYFKQHKNFSGEVDKDGTMRYTLGEFRDYWEADKFKKYLRGTGVKGAWIVAYKDGNRVDIKDALEGSL